MSERHIKLSDNAKVSGLSVASTGGRTLVLGVLPKMWAEAGEDGRAPARRHHVRWPDEASQLRLTGYEGDVVTVEGDARALRCVDALVNYSAKQARGKGAALASATSAPDSLDLWELPSLTDLSALIELASRVSEEIEVRHTSHLPMTVDDPLLGDLIRWQFVRAAEQAVRDLRRRYRERDDWIPAVRGRILPDGWTLARANGFTRTLCRFEEFEIGSPVLDVVAAALTTVANAGRPSTESLTTIHRANRRDAAKLRRHLHMIDEPHPTVVRRLVSQPLSVGGGSAWEQALELAKLVLQDSDGRIGVPEKMSSTDVAGFELRVQTWHIWEQVLERSRDHAVGRQGIDAKTLSPFTATRSDDLKPDLPVVDDHGDKRLWVLDAKYKRAAREQKVVSRSDAYQIFAYSHLASVGDLRPQGVGILYPVPCGVEPWHASAGRRNPDGTLPIITAGLPFPQPPDCTEGGWEHYLDQTLTPALSDHVLNTLRSAVDAAADG